MGLGANIAVRVLDLSDSGVRLLVRRAVKPGQEVEVTLESIGLVKPVTEPYIATPPIGGVAAPAD